jgi:hypothetical protein
MPEILYKDRLLARFRVAREAAGEDWRKKLSKHDSFFNTKEGTDLMARASSAVTDRNRIGVDNLEKIVVRLEKMVETYAPEEV